MAARGGAAFRENHDGIDYATAVRRTHGMLGAELERSGELGEPAPKESLPINLFHLATADHELGVVG